ncbi:MAG: hypothetical protein IPO56_12720 [Flavobacteriales bacterium]|nr:hypothetical protein [Flavobacteriales bacterium]
MKDGVLEVIEEDRRAAQVGDTVLQVMVQKLVYAVRRIDLHELLGELLIVILAVHCVRSEHVPRVEAITADDPA